MEDISRELEREIAKARPKPHKTRQNKNVLVVDDFGNWKSGTYLRVMTRVLSATTLVFGIFAASLYFGYARQADENKIIKEKLSLLEIRVGQLTHEKEILMAKLVMSGQKPMLDGVAETGPNKTAAKNLTKKQEIKEKSEPAPKSEETPEPELSVQADAGSPSDSEQEKNGQVSGDGNGPSLSKTSQVSDVQPVVKSSLNQDLVSVEKFSISGNQNKDELSIRFNIRNIKEGPGGISGRIFLVLKPENAAEDNWVVVPKTPLENGIPSLYSKGQYFSISRFKPVKFIINSQADPRSFKSAAVYIFDDGGGLIYKDVRDILVKENG